MLSITNCPVRLKIIYTVLGVQAVRNHPGEAISLITPEEQQHFKVIQKKMGKRVDMIDSENFDFKGY